MRPKQLEAIPLAENPCPSNNECFNRYQCVIGYMFRFCTLHAEIVAEKDNLINSIDDKT